VGGESPVGDGDMLEVPGKELVRGLCSPLAQVVPRSRVAARKVKLLSVPLEMRGSTPRGETGRRMGRNKKVATERGWLVGCMYENKY
jgi:hypothetical protein